MLKEAYAFITENDLWGELEKLAFAQAAVQTGKQMARPGSFSTFSRIVKTQMRGKMPNIGSFRTGGGGGRGVPTGRFQSARQGGGTRVYEMSPGGGSVSFSGYRPGR